MSRKTNENYAAVLKLNVLGELVGRLPNIAVQHVGKKNVRQTDNNTVTAWPRKKWTKEFCSKDAKGEGGDKDKGRSGEVS